ncbi:Dopey, N-terminal-domain-containing protein [Chytriomyces cf. hyalinus JEL632]|nr:Dopey, N-terminal-domain-containing protein [Chytriomyces cf. hyalinus JEL632]
MQDAEALQKDPVFKRYVGSIDSILKLFDAVNDWADVIGFLSKLLKTLQQHAQYRSVPRKLIVSKRLAQCLNPALPSGVHQKTLEVYNAILEAAGPAQLAEDLPLWSYGLFPFLQNAAMSVKPILLQIYNRHYLNLGPRVKPSLKGLILALLPGLEEEGNEFFDPVMKMFDTLMVNLGTPYFLHCMGLAVISGNRVRGAAMNYLLRRLPKFTAKKELQGILGDESIVMSRALGCALEDKQILVQRGALELLVVHFPLEADLFPTSEIEILMRSAVGVVLRKDISLNRRLYSWLLGPSETLSTTVRDSLVSTLLAMLWVESNDLLEITNTFRIIISLMDKDEIGSFVMERIILDLFKSLKWRSEESPIYKEILQSADMLLDAINPFILWKRLYYLVSMSSSTHFMDSESVHLLDYVFTIIRFDDEEVQTVHMPIFYHAMMHAIEDIKFYAESKAISQQLRSYLDVSHCIISRIPQSVITNSWTLGSLRRRGSVSELDHSVVYAEEQLSNITASSVKSFCAAFYGANGTNADPCAVENEAMPSNVDKFVLGGSIMFLAFQVLETFLPKLIRESVIASSYEHETRSLIVSSLGVASKMIETLACLYLKNWRNSIGSRLGEWRWLSAFNDGVLETSDFSILNICTSALINIISAANAGQIHLCIDSRHFIQASANRLWHYLDPGPFAIYHSRCVDLIWLLCDVAEFGAFMVENVIANFLSSRDSVDQILHQHRFGVLWRLSLGTHRQPGIVFSRALFLVLDGLRSQNPSIRRAGEVWLKTFVTNYSSVIEPVLATLLHQDIQIFTHLVKVNGREERAYSYKREFNMGQVLYSLETLCLFLDFGKIEFLRFPMIYSFAEFSVQQPELSCAEILIYVCLRFLRCEISMAGKMQGKFDKLQSLNNTIQTKACEFISKFLSHSEMDATVHEIVSKVVYQKIMFSIGTRQLDLQPRLLQILLAMLENQEKIADSQKLRRDSLTVSEALDNLILTGREALGLSPSGSKLDEKALSVESSPTFLSMILEALIQPSNRAVLQHWMDFVILHLPRVHTSFRSILQPIISEICHQILVRESEISAYLVLCESHSASRSAVGPPDNDVVILVAALDKIIAFCLLHDANWSKNGMDKGRGNASNIWDYSPLGMVTSVFTEAPAAEITAFEALNSRDAIIELLPGIIEVLHRVFMLFKEDPFVSLNSENSGSIHAFSGASLEYLSLSVKESIRQILENVHAKHPAHLFEAAIEVWFSKYPELADRKDLADKTTPRYSVVSMLHTIETSSDSELMLEIMANVVEGLKTRFQFLTNSASSKNKDNIFYLKSRQIVITVSIEKLITTKHFEDKRMRFHMDELYQKMLELSVQYAMKPDIANITSVSPKAGLSPLTINTARLRYMPEPKKSLITADVLDYWVAEIIPNIRKLFLDQERILMAFSNLVYYVVAPAVKANPNLSAAKYLTVRRILLVASKLVFVVKTWKKEVWDAFMESKFWEMGIESFRDWKTIMTSLVSADRESKITELATKVSVASSTSLFASREQELLLRISSLRRVSFLIWCGSVDQFLPQLPQIQEKLVEVLKGPAGLMHIEAYLCLRVLMCRMKAHHLSNLWPVVLTELIQIFGVYLRDQGSKQDLEVFLACCKLLELLLLLGTEEFQWHQWIFVGETFLTNDTDDLSPSLIDRLSHKWESYHASETASTEISNTSTLRRPVLTMKSVKDKAQLAPFIATLSRHTYASTFSRSKPDLEFIDTILEADLTDNRTMSIQSAPPPPSPGVAILL